MDVFPQPLQRVTTPTQSVFDEARETIDQWEKADPKATHIALVLDGEADIVVEVAGPAAKPSALAGLLFNAATMVAAT